MRGRGSSVMGLWVFVPGMWFLVIRRELDYARGDWSLAIGPILGLVVPLAGFLLLLFGGIAIWGRRAVARNQTLAESSPSALILACRRTALLVRSIDSVLDDDGVQVYQVSLPAECSLVISAAGMSAWGGPPMAPHRLFEISADAIADVQPTRIVGFGYFYAGFVVTTRPSTGDADGLELPFVVMRRRGRGIFAESWKSVNAISHDVRKMFDVSADQPDAAQ